VANEDRATKGSLTMAWWGVCSAMFYLVIGIAMAENYGTKNAIIGLLISCVAYGIVNGIITRYAIRIGMSVALFSRVLFGHKGAWLSLGPEKALPFGWWDVAVYYMGLWVLIMRVIVSKKTASSYLGLILASLFISSLFS